MSCYTASTNPHTLYKDSYRDKQMEEDNEFGIVASGNPRTDMDRVSDYAILRSAQVMEREGFKYFVVSNEIKDYNVEKVLYTQAGAGGGYGYAATGVVDVSNPVVGLVVTGYNEKPKPESGSGDTQGGSKKKQKLYKTADVLEEFDHYINEKPPKEFNSLATIYAVTIIASIGLPIAILLILI